MRELLPLPKIDMKFSSQVQDHVNGDNLIYYVFGYNVIRWHREFNKFFCVRYLRMVTLPKRTHPNFKVYWLFKHVIKVSMDAWLLGMELSCGDQMQVFQGNHEDKSHITYKSEGDEFQYDTICDNGYTYSIFFMVKQCLMII